MSLRVPGAASRTSGCPALTGSPSSTSHSMIVPRHGGVTGCGRRALDVPISVPRRRCRRDAAAGRAAAEACRPAARPAAATRACAPARASSGAVLGDQLAGRVQVVRGLQGEQGHAGQRPPGQPGQRARRAAARSARSRPGRPSSRMHRSQRTGALTWATIRSSQSAPVVHRGPVPVGQQRHRRVADGDARGRARAARPPPGPCAGCGTRPPPAAAAAARLPAGRPRSAASCGQRPGRHDLPGAVDVRGGQPVRLDRGEHLGLVAAEHGGHPGRLGRRGRRHRPPAHAGPAASRPPAVSTPAMTPAASSPTLCPAAAPAGTQPGRAAEQRRGRGDRGRDQQRLRHRGVPDLVRARRGADLIRSTAGQLGPAPRRSATPGSSSQGDRKPGVCAPWPGAAITSILLPCTVGVRHMDVEEYEVCRRNFVGTSNNTSRRAQSPASTLYPVGRRVRRQPAQDDARPSRVKPSRPVARGVAR